MNRIIIVISEFKYSKIIKKWNRSAMITDHTACQLQNKTINFIFILMSLLKYKFIRYFSFYQH